MLPGRCLRWAPLAVGASAAVALGLGLGACSDGGAKLKDASPDTPVDTAPGTCSEVNFAGEYIDWDATDQSFCGVFGATWTVRGDATRTRMTPPNGRVQLCLPRQAQTLIDVVPPTAGSECAGLAGMPMNTYPLQGVTIASEAVIAGGGIYSARAMVQFRLTSMFAQIGQPMAADHGQLVVHVNGTPRAVSLSATHDATQRFDGTTWAAGDTGSDVFFPNVDLSKGAVSVTMTGTAAGTGSYTLEPGKMTYLSVIAN